MDYSRFSSADPEVENAIIKKFDVIFKNFKVLQELEKWDKENVFINKGILKIALISCYDDFSRYEVYSNIKIVDRHKVAGYVIKWLSRLKPIQSKIIDDEKLFIVNNFFALICGLLYLNIEIDDINLISPDYFEHLLYEIQYRNISGRAYASKLYLLEKLLQSKIPF